MILLTVDEIITIHEKLLKAQQELIELGLGVARGDLAYQNILSWLLRHRVKETGVQ